MGFLFKLIQRVVVPLLFLSFARSLFRDLTARGWQSRTWNTGSRRTYGNTGTGSRNSAGSGQGSASPWDVLGLPRSATNEQIRARYRELIAKYHPDKFAGLNDPEFTSLAAEKFQRVQWAWEELKRRRGM